MGATFSSKKTDFKKFRICLCTVPQFQTLEEVEDLFSKLPTSTTDFFIFPEASFEGIDPSRKYGFWNADHQNQYLQRISKMAKQYEVYIAVTCPVYDPDVDIVDDSCFSLSKFFNRCTIFGRDGDKIGHHDKYELCDGERQVLSRRRPTGDCLTRITKIKLPDLDFPIGVLICRDFWSGVMTRSAITSDIKFVLAPVYCSISEKEAGNPKPKWNVAHKYYGEQFAMHYSSKEIKKKYPKRRLTVCVIDQPYLNKVRPAEEPALGVTCALDIYKDKVKKIYSPGVGKTNYFFLDLRADNGEILNTFTRVTLEE